MRAHVITFGCQMNEYDTHIIQSELVAGGHELVDHPVDADLLLLNTCAVRGKPVEKVVGVLADLRKQRSHGRAVTVGLMGCLAQLGEGRALAEKYAVDLLVGPGAITDLLSALEQLPSGPSKLVERLGFEPELHDLQPPPPRGPSGFLTIMRGCDHHCTYCIVPDTRGPEVSRPHDSVMREARAMRAAGVSEVTLLGQNVNSYGLSGGGPRFPELLRMVADLGFPRVKFTTSHPMNFSSALIDVIAEHPNVCNYIHLPMQSGSDRVLRRMAREYRIGRYLEIVREIRAKVNDVVISTDVIVGFPGETEEDFQATLDAAAEAGFEQAYMFMYSARPGTPSHAHFTDMPRTIKVERLQRLIEQQKARSLAANEALVGRELRVLLKDVGRDSRYAVGHSDQNHTVLVPAESVRGLGLASVEVTGATPHALYGEVAGAASRGVELVMAS